MSAFIISVAEEFAAQAREELGRLLAPHTLRVTFLPAEAALITTDAERSAVHAALQQRPPIFVRHLFPVDAELTLTQTTADLDAVAAAVEPLLGAVPRGTAVAVQARRLAGTLAYTPYAVKERLDPLLIAAGLVPEVKAPAWVVSLAFTADRCYLGVSSVVDNLSSWAGGMMRFRAEDDDISRAKRKLLEALAVFAVDLTGVYKALDLGAAPGGWTSALIEREIAVTAVDTGQLDARLADSPLVTFLQRNAEELRLPANRFDLLTSDISWDPLHTATMLVRLAPVLRPGGQAIVTVKLMHRGIWGTLAEVTRTLASEYEVRGARHLFHNRREITLLLRRRG